jgi:hypothetical protein
MDTVGAYLKGEADMVAHDESSAVIRAQRLEICHTRNQTVHILRGGFKAQHEARDAAHGEGSIQLLGQSRRLVTGRADQQELAARLGRGDRLVQGASSSPLTLRRDRS